MILVRIASLSAFILMSPLSFSQQATITTDELEAIRELEAKFSLKGLSVSPQVQSRSQHGSVIYAKEAFIGLRRYPSTIVSSYIDHGIRTEELDFSSDPFLIDEEALWAWAEDKVRPFVDVSDLDRSRQIASSGVWRGSEAPSISFKWEQSHYYGYMAGGGTHAILRVRKRDGKLIYLSVGPKITAAPPDIRISRAEAVELAARSTGWDRSTLQGKGLWYGTVGLFGRPKEPYHLTLAYTISQDGADVMVDAKTGEVSQIATVKSSAKSPTTGGLEPKAAEIGNKTGPSSRDGMRGRSSSMDQAVDYRANNQLKPAFPLGVSATGIVWLLGGLAVVAGFLWMHLRRLPRT